MSSQPDSYRPPSLWFVHLMMLVAAGLVSTSFTVGKAITMGMDPLVLTLIRFTMAALLFLPITGLRNDGLHWPGRGPLIRYSVISLTLTGFFWLMFVSLQSTTALNTGVIYTLVPGLSSLYSAIILRERLGRYRIMAMVPATAGAVWVLFHGDVNRLMAFDLNPGDLLFFAACLLVAAYTPLVKLLHRGEPMTIMTFWILVTGCGWLLLFSGPQLLQVAWADVSLKIWTGIIYLATFCTIATFFLSQWATLYLGPTRVSAYSYLYPPCILVIDWFFTRKLPPIRTLPGILLIILAMFVVQQGSGSSKGCLEN